MIKRAWSIFLEILFPAICIDCGSYLPKSETQNALCGECFTSIEFFKVTPHPHLIAVGPYNNDALKALIHGLKFKRFTHTLPQIKALIRDYLNHHNLDLQEYDLITYIPLHPQRERTRGFNQARLIAELLGELTNIQVQPTLKRIHHKGEQSSTKSAQGKLSNVRGCFIPRRDIAENKERILLVDDVYTSGATASEAIKILNKDNPKRITIFVLAKAG